MLRNRQLDNKIHSFLERKEAEHGDISRSFNSMYSDLTEEPRRGAHGLNHARFDVNKFIDY